MKIYKYELEIKSKQNIKIGGAMPTILSAKEQDGKLMLWAALEEDYPGEFDIDIEIIGTGNPYQPDPNNKFIDTVIMTSGCVWHVFSKINYKRGEI